MSTIKKIVLTGGPCAGKTTARAYLMQKLGDLGYHVVFVPEAPTLLMHSGIKPGGILDGEAFQRAVLDLTLMLEDNLGNALADMRYGMKPVMICDRGVMDGLAYLGDRDLFAHWLSNRGFSIVDVRDRRYDAVFHLVTAADGAEAYYTLDTNSSRSETAEQAREADKRTLAAWNGCPKLRPIPNTGTLDDKLKRLLTEICAVLGVPEPVETERRFLVKPNFNPSGLGDYELVDIEQFYLISNDPNEALRFRKRSQNGEAVYFETRKRPGPHPASNIETEDFITAEQYEFGKQFMLPGSRFVRKERLCFVYLHQYFELDVFAEPKLDYCLLELELAHPDQPMTLPPFLSIEQEVTGDTSWGNYALATRP
ncbi:MAG: AAA family ATPase [bacterium]|nr:AAA family ATPase [bacterium]